MAKRNYSRFTDLVWTVTEEGIFKDDLSFEFHSFVLIISGEMKVIQAERTYIFGADSMLLFPRNQISTVIKQPMNNLPYQAVVFGLTVDKLKAFYANERPNLTAPPDSSVRILNKQPLLESFFASVIPYLNLEQPLPEKIAELKLYEAISILRSIEPDIDSVLSDFSEPGKINLVDFMEKHFKFNMPLEKFAYLTGRSLSTFIRDFKKAFKITPQRWLTIKRLELAHFQLSKKEKKATEIYLETGFENLSHFSFAFKKHFGYPPSEILGKLT
ncbi:Exoenzyme S synthesis regulatory protein ExsA [Pedobacter sp. Bi27]|uniref:helix-turn-helix domain-containing protein n=1 Tax=unclassified Pedobacter TaxID=2628915 RepID=UPI001D6E8EDF|nr:MULTISPECIES: AraC family transcriptional regulator [unclassified Pedobacter]CAH0142264.1 Exoenzyme S synthesis regulatory protein ExsA [Pedobacter sp. Bi36]CAH0198016.1 Exoenzyme S synthesis regulatory protein ExsA [Pedobacter sp. Bi126]CAH0256820.1 Exoenzyme S synthesis regulatory protein ExsA [Pedobacter sp. Bi27]